MGNVGRRHGGGGGTVHHRAGGNGHPYRRAVPVPRKVEDLSQKEVLSGKKCFVSSGGACATVKELFQTDRFNRLVIERENGDTVYRATLHTDREFSSAQLNEIMESNLFIRSIERCDET